MCVVLSGAIPAASIVQLLLPMSKPRLRAVECAPQMTEPLEPSLEPGVRLKAFATLSHEALAPTRSTSSQIPDNHASACLTPFYCPLALELPELGESFVSFCRGRFRLGLECI